jgi:hypothetical protein
LCANSVGFRPMISEPLLISRSRLFAISGR